MTMLPCKWWLVALEIKVVLNTGGPGGTGLYAGGRGGEVELQMVPGPGGDG